MLLQQGDSRTEHVDRRLGWTLAAIAGVLNTAAFHAVGYFAANMTGNVSQASNQMAFGYWWAGAFFLAILLFFILGAAVATLLTNYGRRRRLTGIYAVGILVEAVLMAGLGGLCLLLPASFEAPLLVLGLSFLMGLQNAVVTRISNAKVRTTHVSGMTTDIGIELAMLLDACRGKEIPQELSAYRNRLRLHSQTLLAFLLGGVAGALLYQAIGLSVLFACAALLFAMALRALIKGAGQRGGLPGAPGQV